MTCIEMQHQTHQKLEDTPGSAHSTQASALRAFSAGARPGISSGGLRNRF